MTTWFKAEYALGEITQIQAEPYNPYSLVARIPGLHGHDAVYYLPRTCRAFSVWPTRAEADADMLKHWTERETECAKSLTEARAMLAKLKPEEEQP